MKRSLVLKTRIQVSVLTLCFLGLLFPLMVSAADPGPTLPVFSGPRVTDPVIYVGVPCEVLFRVDINDEENLIPTSVNLLRYDAKGVRRVVDRLYDDGTHGDWTPNDGTFTNRITLTETQPGIIKFQVSAAWKGEVQRRMSDIVTIEVLPLPDLEGVWNAFVDRLVNKDLEGALTHVTLTAKDDYRRIFGRAGMDKIAGYFKTARDFRVKSIERGGAEFTFMATINGSDQHGSGEFQRDNDGVWRIYSVGF